MSHDLGGRKGSICENFQGWGPQRSELPVTGNSSPSGARQERGNHGTNIRQWRVAPVTSRRAQVTRHLNSNFTEETSSPQLPQCPSDTQSSDTPHSTEAKRRSKPCKKIHFVQSYRDCTEGVLSLSKSLLGLKAQQDPSLGTGWVGNPGGPQSPREEQVRPNYELPKRSQASRNQAGRQGLHLGQTLSPS